MKVLESLCIGKFDKERCEDALFRSENFIAVIDGVSSKTTFRYQGKTTGKIAAELIDAALQTLPADADLSDFIAAVNSAYSDCYKKINFPEQERQEKGLQAVCALYSKHRRTIWQIGDCQVLVDGKEYKNSKKSDRIICEMRNLILEELQQRDGNFLPSEHEAKILDVLFPWMIQTIRFANSTATDYGYSVLNGTPIPESLIQTIPLDLSVHEIVLASDGYPQLCQTIAQSEQVLAEMLKKDPQGRKLFDTVRLIKEDQKSFDDRTYIRFLTD